MKNTNPFFSVVIPVYNNAEFLQKTLKSVVNQSFGYWETIVIDDGSSDNSLEIAEIFAKDHERIYVITHQERENKGVSASRNLGVKMAKGEWIAFLDADDIWYDNRLESHFDVIQKHTDSSLAFIYSTSRIINDNDKIINNRDEAIDYNFRYGIYGAGRVGLSSNAFKWVVDKGFEAPTSSVTIKLSVLRDKGGFDEKLIYSEDAILWYRVIENTSLYFINEPLLNYRVHKSAWNASVNNELKISRRFKAYEYLIDKVSGSHKNYIVWLLINKGFRVIVRSYCGYPFLNLGLVLSKLIRLFSLKSVSFSLKLYSIIVVLSELLLIPVRVIRDLFHR